VFRPLAGKVAQETNFYQQSRSWIDEWLLGKLMARALADLGLNETDAWRAVAVIKLLTTHQRWFEMKGPKEKRAYQVLEAALQDAEIQQFIQVNRWQGALWFNKESLEGWLWWMLLIAEVDAQRAASADEVVQRIAERYAVIAELMQAEEESEYQVEKLLEAVRATPSASLQSQTSPRLPTLQIETLQTPARSQMAGRLLSRPFVKGFTSVGLASVDKHRQREYSVSHNKVITKTQETNPIKV